MFGALGRLASRRPWYVIGAWLVFAVLVIALAPKFEATTDQSEFLPAEYESIKAFELQDDAFPQQASPGAIIVFDRADGEALDDDDTAAVEEVVAGLQGQLGDAFSGVQAQPPSENGLVQIAVVGLADDVTGFEESSLDSVQDLRDDLGDLVEGTDLRYGVTGQLAQGYDSQEQGNRALEIVGIATIVLIVGLLAIIFRSVIICLLPILVVALVSQVATGLIATANEIFDLKASSDVQVILIVVLYGIGTDYILFFLFRYRERLREGEETRGAVAHALERAGEAIASAGGAVIVSFMALVLSSLGIFRSIGPALAIAVAVTLVASLTLVPAIVALLGKALFWPSRKWRQPPTGSRFAALGRTLGRRPAAVAGASGGVLLVLAVFAFGFNPSFDFTGSSVPKDSESTVALERLEKGLPAGATDPTTVFLHDEDGEALAEADLAAFGEALGGADQVGQVAPPQVSEDGATALYNVVLQSDPSSDAAIAAVKGSIRDTAHDAAPDGTEALVGGTTSVFVDFQAAMTRDYKVVFPVAAIVIMLILALLLRSLVAPIYLMVSVGLGFGATLGASVIVFQHLMGDAGLIFLLPIYIYLFVVALGTDYNILMIARLREEAREGKDSRSAAAQAVTHAGPTIAAAGVILAGTFAALMLGGNSLFVSMGFAISLGIAIAAFVMSMFFTPALTALMGHAAWWPGHGDETREASLEGQAGEDR
ncbi:MMPL family transporter [Nocardioides sp. SYSU D00038]|uniref:MMPL family transporter n=1 Tax=Nocardioides sp. SYSU D00038 TaxID=2812554 RepID=UPI001967E80F|nr:MMPL family transporter [Nocardioides sp. SYSU D00038]